MLLHQENKSAITPRKTELSPFLERGQTKGRQPVLELHVGSALDPGITRKQDPNEDTLSVIRGVISSTPPKPFTLMIVADGMGGQARGQEASRLAVQSLSKCLMASLRTKQQRPEAFIPLLKEGVAYANQMIYQRNRQQRTNMGTTITVALVIDDNAYIAHVGDSRLYLYREPDGLSQITEDHSLVAALVAAGAIQPEDIYTHPSRNIIYRCLGERATVEVDTSMLTLADGDILLLCSDGLWEMVRDSQIARILTTPMPDPFDTARALIQAALAGGGEDNVSAIVARVSEIERHRV
jgi:serine/threonine protein phosphatase PrpC